MEINILNTHKLYCEMMSIPDKDRSAFFNEKILEPFAPMFEKTMMPRNPEAISCFPLTGADDVAKGMLNQLMAMNVWTEARYVIENSINDLQKVGIKMPEKMNFSTAKKFAKDLVTLL